LRDNKGGFLRYDTEGNLWINGLRVVDAINMYGSPIEIVDTTIIERRAAEWQEMAKRTAREAGYDPEKLEYFYAAKANMSSEITAAAYRSGWMAETSGSQDLENIRWMEKRGLVNRESFRIICNGFKLPPQVYGQPKSEYDFGVKSSVTFDQEGHRFDGDQETSYADNIVLLRTLGFDITPILDSDELSHFAQGNEVPMMEVGLRMKMGKVSQDEELDQLVFRHGMAWEEIKRTAKTLERVDHLNLTILHAMVGAAETMEVDSFVENLLFAVDKYFELKKISPGLTTFNMGGRMAPRSENYDHERFLRKLLKGVKERAEAAGLETPRLQFEFGSYLAAEAGFHAFKIIQMKRNNVDSKGEQEVWAIANLGLMGAIPDMLIIGKDNFQFLAANNGLASPMKVRIGDLTCDSDGIWPTKAMEPRKVWIPDAPNTHMVIAGVGAYQEILAGIRGVHHCGGLEAVELILEKRNDGLVYARVVPRQTSQESRKMLGYNPKAGEALRATLVNL